MGDNSDSPARTGKRKAWIEAMRPRTLPVSAAGVLAAWGVALDYGCFKPLPGLICLLFALGAQIASNFANEYFDYRNGLDRKGREGFRRGVTEGDITPGAMLRATLLTLGISCALGLTLIIWGGWWLIGAGIVIAVFALAYSAGPYPLSHHGLGDVAVIIFFGLVPVLLTLYVMSPDMSVRSAGGGMELWRSGTAVGLAAGMMAACVLIVNNVRDEDDDRAVGKQTTAVIFGGPTMKCVYFLFAAGAVTMLTMFNIRTCGPVWGWLSLVPGLFWLRPFAALMTRTGAALNPVLGLTARTMLFNVGFLLLAALFH